jgi:hypothetical protein
MDHIVIFKKATLYGLFYIFCILMCSKTIIIHNKSIYYATVCNYIQTSEHVSTFTHKVKQIIRVRFIEKKLCREGRKVHNNGGVGLSWLVLRFPNSNKLDRCKMLRMLL